MCILLSSTLGSLDTGTRTEWHPGALERVHNIHGSHRLATSTNFVSHGVTDDPLGEGFQAANKKLI